MIRDLGQLLPLHLVNDALTSIENLPIIDHVYGEKQPSRKYPFWMRYTQKRAIGQISFTRNTGLINDPYFTLLIDEAERVLNKLLSPSLTVNRHHIHIIRTSGNIVAHIDEGGRVSCINMGLRNASSAVTTSYAGSGIESLSLTDGGVCLLDTSIMHDVKGDENIMRYAITYGMTTPCDEVFQIISASG